MDKEFRINDIEVTILNEYCCLKQGNVEIKMEAETFITIFDYIQRQTFNAVRSAIAENLDEIFGEDFKDFTKGFKVKDDKSIN